MSKASVAHANVMQSVELVRQYKPAKALLVGMGHDFEHRAANVAATAMIAAHIQRRPAELSCTCTVCTAEYVFAVRGGRRLSVALKAWVVAAKAST